MSEGTNNTGLSANNSIRILPGIIIVIIQWLVRFAMPMIIPSSEVFGIFGGLLGGLAFIIWWLFFSRAPKVDRWIAFPRFGEEIGGRKFANFSFSKLISMANVFIASFIFMVPFVRSVFKLVSLLVSTGKSQAHYDWNVKKPQDVDLRLIDKFHWWSRFIGNPVQNNFQSKYTFS